MQVSILTPLFNRLDLTRACVASLRRTLAGWDYEWIFIDDGSTDGTRDFLRALAAEDARVRVVCNDAPRGFAANNNHAARLARAPLLCLLNNDTVLLPGWLEPMARLARRRPDVACVGNVQREPVSGLVDHAGIYFNHDGYAQHAGKDQPAPPGEDYLEWAAVTAACCVIRRKLFWQLGGFDEAFRNGCEDVDFCLRAGVRGYRHYVANRSEIYHHISASPGRKGGEEENLRLFRARWLPRLHGDLRARRTRRREAAAGWRYLRKHAARPWRYNGWRLRHAVARIVSPGLPLQRLDAWSRLWFRWQDFFRRQQMENAAAAVPAVRRGPPVFVVMGDTARTADRAGVPTFVRCLAATFGRLGAPVQPVIWKPATRSLGLLPPAWSIGLDAEPLRTPFDPAWREPSVPSLYDPVSGNINEPATGTPSLHELAPPGSIPRGAWIVLPEVLTGGATDELRGYAHAHGWKLAVILHDLLPVTAPRFFPLTAPSAHAAYLAAVSRADLVLPVSGFVAGQWRQYLAAKGFPAPPLEVCAPGADTCRRPRATAGARRLPGDPVRILCVSAVVPRKNHRALLAAFDLAVAARPDLPLELDLVGMPRLFNDDDVPAAVWNFAARHPGRVRWKEWVEYSTLAGLYEACDFTVFPSVLEGHGSPITESLWFGKPCICANFGSMAATAAGGGCVPVDVRDPQALADAILSLATPARRDALTAEIAARPLKTWEEYARELLDLLAPGTD